MIGDVLTSTVLFEAIKLKYPKAKVDYLINTHTFPVVKHNPYVDNCIFFTKEMETNKKEFWKFLKLIRDSNYDIVIDLYGKISSILISRFSKAKIKISYKKKYTEFIYTHVFKRLKKPTLNVSLAIENRMKLLEFIDIPFINIKPKIYFDDPELLKSKQFLEHQHIDLSKPLLMISVLGSSEKKTYPKSYMAKVLDTIVEYRPSSQLLFNYIPKQKEKAKEIYNLCNLKTQKRIYFDVFGESLRSFIAITKHCDALIGNEGGAVNMAKAMDIPTFTIFNPALNKMNWFGEIETKKHTAVHAIDFLDLSMKEAKKDPTSAYQMFKPKYFSESLQKFLNDNIS